MAGKKLEYKKVIAGGKIVTCRVSRLQMGAKETESVVIHLADTEKE